MNNTDNRAGIVERLIDEVSNETQYFFSNAQADGFTKGQTGSSPWIDDERMVNVIVAIKNEELFKVRFTPKSRHDGPTLRGIPREESFNEQNFESWVEKHKVRLTDALNIEEILSAA